MSFNSKMSLRSKLSSNSEMFSGSKIRSNSEMLLYCEQVRLDVNDSKPSQSLVICCESRNEVGCDCDPWTQCAQLQNAI